MSHDWFKPGAIVRVIQDTYEHRLCTNDEVELLECGDFYEYGIGKVFHQDCGCYVYIPITDVEPV